MIPHHITAAHVQAALEHIDREGVPRGRAARRYLLVRGDRTYPPKYTVAVAHQIATGRPLDPESYGGGEETNGFLRELGFEVVDRHARARSREGSSPRSAVSLRVRVARAWMRLQVGQTEFRRTARAQRWAEHQRLVAEQFDEDPRGYVRRIEDLVARAADERADVLLLPACTLAHRGRVRLEDYDLSAVPLVVSGALALAGPAGEYAVAARSGRVFHRFDSHRVHWFDAGGFSVMAAISSTIKRLAELPDEEPERVAAAPPRSGPVLLLDAGHHPYSDHYRRHTLRRAAASAAQRAGQPAAAILASWQFATTRPTPSWCMPDTSATWRRVHDDRDLLDVLDVTLR